MFSRKSSEISKKQPKKLNFLQKNAVYALFAARALGRKAWRILTRQQLLVSEREGAARMLICHKCPKSLNGHCSICGCSIPLKVIFVDETCPDRPPKW